MDYQSIIDDLVEIAGMRSTSLRKRETCKDAANAITELIARAEEAEAENKSREEASFREHSAMHYWRDRARNAERCINDIEDDLDRGNDNDWAIEHIAEWRRQKAVCENDCCDLGCCPFADPVCEETQNIIDRLAAYEDTGLTPEEIIEMKGRLEGLEK